MSRTLANRAVAILIAVAVVLIALPAFAASDPDGAYTGNIVGSSGTKVRHKVTNNGKFIRRWYSVMGATCGLSVGVTTVYIPVMRVKASGSFRGRYHPNSRIDLKYRGARSGRRAHGNIEGTNNGCYVKFDWKSHHK